MRDVSEKLAALTLHVAGRDDEYVMKVEELNIRLMNIADDLLTGWAAKLHGFEEDIQQGKRGVRTKVASLLTYMESFTEMTAGDRDRMPEVRKLCAQARDILHRTGPTAWDRLRRTR